jgi:hypothetical protein
LKIENGCEKKLIKAKGVLAGSIKVEDSDDNCDEGLKEEVRRSQ